MKYALALAGGGTRGAFEVGVWQALNELGIEISAIAGTSIGAVNGAVFCAGTDARSLWQKIKAADVADIKGDNLFTVSSFFSALKSLPFGGIDASAFANFLATYIDEEKIRKSDIEFGLCTYRADTKNCEELFIDEIPDGKLVDYILASSCFPMFRPVNIGGVEYSDGGIRNNLPVNMLIDRGYDSIISVSVKGIGMVKNIDRCGINIINIGCKKPEIGIMDFDSESILKSMKSGYYECKKVFGKYKGTYYPIDCDSFDSALVLFGPDIVTGIEEAAVLCNIDMCRVYTFEYLVNVVFATYRNCRKLRFLVHTMQKKRFGRGFLDTLGKYFRAANSIIYLSKHKYEKFP